ncbi:MAG: sulfurtransferase TusA family protein [Formosimonas sp.]
MTQYSVSELDEQVVKTEDARGLNCPMPILRTKKALASLAGGELLKVLTTDKSAVSDLSVFTKQTRHELLAQIEASDFVVHYVRKRADV